MKANGIRLFQGSFVESCEAKDEEPSGSNEPASKESNKIDVLKSFSQKRGVKLYLDLRRARRNSPPPVNPAANQLEAKLEAGAGEG